MPTVDAVRPAAVAGMFYPGDAVALREQLADLLSRAPPSTRADTAPKALVVPHAGYVYSGAMAARAWALVAPHAGRYARVVMVGPAHRVWVEGFASAGVDAFRTPLGDVPVDTAWLGRAPWIPASPRAHRDEHCLEVQLPFVQTVLPGVPVVPLLCGGASPDEAARTFDALWGGPETLLVVSTDLSHQLPYAVAQRSDARTAARIVAADPDDVLSGEDACGAHPLNGLLRSARRHGLHAELLGVHNSGDTAGPRDHVVGYAAVAFTQEFRE